MKDNQNAMRTVLQAFDEHRQHVEDPSRRDWKWREGTLLFPEGRCCFCGEPVRSNRLWVVEQGWLRGQLDIEKAVFEKPEHPHAGTDGSLCLGGSNSSTEALFFGVNPADPVMRSLDIPEWYAKMFDHVCGVAGALKPSELFSARAGMNDGDDEDEDHCDDCCNCCDRGCCTGNDEVCDCGCSECYCIPPICQLCEGDIGDERTQVRTNDLTWKWACSTCLVGFTACSSCYARIANAELVAVDDARYCSYCAERWTTVPASSMWTVPAALTMSTTTNGDAVTREMIQAALDRLS